MILKNIYKVKCQKGGFRKIVKESILILKNTYTNFIYNLKEMILFETIYKLMVIIVFVPINYLILDVIVFRYGDFNITNTDMIKATLTPINILLLVIMIIISFVAIFIEMTILSYIANKSRRKIKANYIEGIVNLKKILPQKPTIYIIFAILLPGIIAPITGLSLYTSLIKQFSIPSFIMLELFKSVYGKILFFILIIALIILLLRWLLSIPAIVIEDVDLKTAFKNSIKIYKTNKFKIMLNLILFEGINIIVKLFLLVTYMEMCNELIFFIGVKNPILKNASTIMIIIFIIGYSVISIIQLPLYITFLLELYYKYRNYNVKERTFVSIKKPKYIKIVNGFSIACFMILIGLMCSFTLLSKATNKDISITAHRGSSMFMPENSMTSIRTAIIEQSDYAEIDVMTTKDNQVVLFHDSSLKRVDGTNRKIKNMTLEEVKTVDNGSYKNKIFKNEKIPTLEEVFKEFRGKIKFNIELKPTGKDDLLAQEVAKLVEKYNMKNEVVISSLNKDVILQYEEDNFETKTGYIISFGLGDLVLTNVDFLSVEYSLLNSKLIENAHKHDKEVHVWTLNNINKVNRALDLGVDNIITDDIEMTKSVLQERLFINNTPQAIIKKYMDKNNSIKSDIYELFNGNMDYSVWFKESILSIIRYVKI